MLSAQPSNFSAHSRSDIGDVCVNSVISNIITKVFIFLCCCNLIVSRTSTYRYGLHVLVTYTLIFIFLFICFLSYTLLLTWYFFMKKKCHPFANDTQFFPHVTCSIRETVCSDMLQGEVIHDYIIDSPTCTSRVCSASYLLC